MNRREFLKISGNLSVLSVYSLMGYSLAGFGLTGFAGCKAKEDGGGIVMSPLPYGEDELEPFLSTKSLYLHYSKYQKYVEKTNALVAGTRYEQMSLPQIIKKTHGTKDDITLYNNAAQVFNHTFFWDSMAVNGGGVPKGRIGSIIRESFGSYKRFSEIFFDAALSHFGSGWVWLYDENNKLSIMTASNADNPVAFGKKPVLALDIWEHSYYLDYHNQKGAYIKTYLDRLLNWEFAENNLF